jgi:serine/threonine-protein kinase RsbW
VRRHILADGSALADVRRTLRTDLASAGAEETTAFDCLVAVTEACTNALVHGRADTTPQVSWVIDGGTARFVVEDYSGFWGRTEVLPRMAEPERRVGGFGLDLMRSLMDEVDITVASGGTTVELAKRLL